MFLLAYLIKNPLSLFRLSVGVVAALAFSGCATMTEGQCLTADWYEQGYRDGRQGFPASRVIDHRDACAVVGVVPDMEEYDVGRDRGLEVYCEPSNAIALGRAGGGYANVCPIRLEERFLFYYRQGLLVHEAQENLDSLSRQSRVLQDSLEKTEDAEEQKRLRGELRDLDGRLERARENLADTERSIRYR